MHSPLGGSLVGAACSPVRTTSSSSSNSSSSSSSSGGGGRRSSAARSAAGSSSGPGRPVDKYVNAPVTLEGTLTKELFADRGYKAMQIEVSDAQWESVVRPAITAVPPPQATQPGMTNAQFFAAKRSRNSRTVTITGKELACSIVSQRCRLHGRWQMNAKFGLQVLVDRVEALTLESDEDLVFMLKSCLPGVGGKTAELMVAHFGKRLIAVLDSDTGARMLQQVEGIGRVKSGTIKTAWDKYSGTLMLAARLQQLGLRPTACEPVVDRLNELREEAVGTNKQVPGTGGAALEALLKRDPYAALLGVWGVSFADAEAVAARLGGVDPHLPSRAGFAMLQVLAKAAEEGHSFLTWAWLRSSAMNLLSKSASGARSAAGAASNGVGSSSDDDPQALFMPAWVDAEVPLTSCASAMIADERMVLEVPTDFKGAGGGGVHVVGSDPKAVWPGTTRAYISSLYNAERDLAAAVAQRVGRHLDAQALAATSGGVSIASSTASSSTSSTVTIITGTTAAAAAATVAAAAAAASTAASASAALSESVLGQLSSSQMRAVELACKAPIMLLTGDAGCGKTLTTRAIVERWVGEGKHVAICAPTGRAAQRLQELVGHAVVEAKTLHRLLGYKGTKDAAKEAAASAEAAAGGTGASAQASSNSAATAEPAAVGAPSPVDDGMGYAELCHDLSEQMTYNANKRLEVDAVLVDEASMLDLQCAAALVRALPDDAQLLLVGDPNQLPPVGPGHVLSGLLGLRKLTPSPLLSSPSPAPPSESESPPSPLPSSPWSRAELAALLPRVHLGEVFRQDGAGSIVAGALQIRDATYPTSMTLMSPEELLDALRDATGAPGTEDVQQHAAAHIPLRATLHLPGASLASEPVAALARSLGVDAVLVEVDHACTAEGVEAHVVDIVRALAEAGVDVAADVQVMSPMRGGKTTSTFQRGCTVATLNARLQPVMNAGAVLAGAGGSSAALRNFAVADRVVQLANNYDQDVYNGDLGTVRGVVARTRETTVRFPPRPGSTVEHDVAYQASDLWQLQLAWATTVHKSQGGEYPIAVVALHHSAAGLLHTRQLLYTAVTRARQLLLLVSTRAAVDRCLKNDITLTGAQASCVPRRVADLLRARGVACEEAAHPAAHAMRRAAAPGRPVSGAWPSLGRVAQAPPPGETSQGQRSDAAHVDAALDRAAASAPAPAPGPAAAPTPAPAPPRSPMPAQQRPSGRWAAPPSFHRPQVRIIHSGP